MDWTAHRLRLRTWEPWIARGEVREVRGIVVRCRGPLAAQGDLVTIGSGTQRILGEIVGIDQGDTLVLPVENLAGIRAGDPVRRLARPLAVPVGPDMMGRILNGIGSPIDGRGPIRATAYYPLVNHAPNPVTRQRIHEPLSVGIRAIDGLITIGKGQRIGIFAGPGVGKSTLLNQMLKYATADVKVVALVGERGRELRDLLAESTRGEEDHLVTVVTTSDESAVMRLKAAYTATAIAEYFRDQGLDVLLVMDSITRFAMAGREVGVARGEPVATRGYPASVFAELPRLLERAGTAQRGSITGVYTVLVDGDDQDEIIASQVKSILDGHILLERRLLKRGHRPPVDVSASVSRLMPQVTTGEHRAAADRFRALWGTLEEKRLQVEAGAYTPGTNAALDQALALQGDMEQFLQQDLSGVPFAETLAQLEAIVARADESRR